jgi:signal transduction histidine kinase
MSDLLILENKDNDAYQMIFNSSKSLVKTLNDVTGLSKIIQNDEVIKEPLDLALMLDACIFEVQSMLDREDMHLEKRYPKTLLVEANRVTKDIYRNFLTNAIKYAAEGKKVIVEVEETLKNIEVKVIDFGQTIIGEDRKRIFERGKQLKNGFKRGSGLGLSIVAKIAKAHNGVVGVRENKPTGNVFYYRFPK